MFRTLLSAAAFAAASVCLAVSASAATVDATLKEVGSDLVFAFSGEVDLSGLYTGFGGTYPANEIGPKENYITSVPTAYQFYESDDTTSSAFGTTPYQAYSRPDESTSTGDVFGFYAAYYGSGIVVDSAFVSGSAVSGSATFFGLSLASIGAVEGVYTFSIGATDINLTVGSAAVPLPASAWLMLSGLAAIATARRCTARAKV